MTASAAPATTPAAPRPQLWRISDRSSFQELRRHGRRARRGPLVATYAADPGGRPPRVGFTIGKAAGGATVRNRIRRRLRAALREELVAGRLPAGTYVLGGSAELATLPWDELRSVVRRTLAAVTEVPA